MSCRLAGLLDIDYARLLQKLILQVMGAPEIAELSRDGVDFQLHTHRHRMPKDESLFQKEIEDNRACLRGVSQREAVHFCYPSGFYSQQFLPWLKPDGGITPTTWDTGLATSRSAA